MYISTIRWLGHSIGSSVAGDPGGAEELLKHAGVGAHGPRSIPRTLRHPAARDLLESLAALLQALSLVFFVVHLRPASFWAVPLQPKE